MPLRAGHLPADRAGPAEGDSWDHVYRCFFPVGGKDDTEHAAAAVTAAEPAPAQAATVKQPNGEPVAARVEHLVKNFPVTAGAVLQRKVGEVSAVADVSFSIRPARPSAWSVSPAAARPRSAG